MAPVRLRSGHSAAGRHAVARLGRRGRCQVDNRRFGCCLFVVYGWQGSDSWLAWSSFRRVETRFRRLVWERRLFYCLRDEGVIAVRQSVAALVAVEGRRERLIRKPTRCLTVTIPSSLKQ